MKQNGLLASLIITMLCAIFIGLLGGCADNDNIGNGNEADPEPEIEYINISTVSDLQGLANQSGNYKFINNIDISGSEWTPIEGFSGLLEGNNYSIQGLTISGNKENIGLFSTLRGTVQNLTISSVNISGTGDAGTAGALCGTNEGFISNVFVSGNIDTPYYNNVGGICGVVSAGANILNCANNAMINAYQNVGGIAGIVHLAKNITCDGNTNNGEVVGRDYVGGIAGRIQCGSPGDYEHENAYFTNNENTKNINGSGNYVGGLVGYISSDTYWGGYATYLTISSCSNSGIINGNNYTGGIVGYADKLSQITSSTNTTDITGGNYVGGYIGYGVGTAIRIATNNNIITGGAYVGGIAGYCGDLTDCTNNGSIISTAVGIQDSESVSYVGGIAGYATRINNCVNNSDISVETGGKYVGGIVGYLYAAKNITCDGNTNNGEVVGRDYVGGIAGRIQCGSPGDYEHENAYFTNNENTKDINGNGNYVGGLVGYISSDTYWGGYATYLTISNCRNSGNIAGNNYVGGILAYGLYCTATDSVWASNSNIGTVTGSNSGMLYGYIG